jgi:MYXO-CTERM domain-containing protein
MKSTLIVIGTAILLVASDAAAEPADCTGAETDDLCEATEPCTCDDCFSDVSCGGCVDDGTCDQSDACTCPDCDDEPVCNTQGSCTDNGECNQFTESCACTDCAEVDNCLDNPPPAEGGAGPGDGGSSAGGGPPAGESDDGGCSASHDPAGSPGALALLTGLAVVALRRRR